MSPLPPDPYKILGVSKDAQIPEIRSAHRKLVLKCHPDKVIEPELKAQKQDEFQKVQRAYEILSDEKERQKYDDSVRLAELREQMRNKANVSIPRSTPKYTEFEVRPSESRPSSYKSGASQGPSVKVYATYARSWEDDRKSSPRYYDAEPRSSRRESSYTEKPSKREDKERESTKDRERRKKKEKEAAEEARQREKDEKKAREKSEKKAREKQRSKNIKRESAEKMQNEDAYIETWEDDSYVPRLDKKKSSRKHEEKRERSSQRDEPPAAPRYAPEEPSSKDHAKDFARAYIMQSRGGIERTKSYHGRMPHVPAAPTPPPAGAPSPFPPPGVDDEPRRSSARPRRGSSDVPPTALPRERSYHRSSRETLDRTDPVILNASPSPRRPMAPPEMAGSPPHISRTNTMPTGSSSRPIPGVGRANTFTSGYPSGASPSNRGRDRSRMHSQVPEETESDEDYDRREHKPRSSRKTRSPEPSPRETRSTTYHVDGGRTKLHSTSSYSRKINADQDYASYYYDGAAQPSARVSDSTRPSMQRDSGYGGSGFSKVKTSRPYGPDDVQYSQYQSPHYRDEYPAAYA